MALELGTLGSARLADSAGADFVMCVTVVIWRNHDSGLGPAVGVIPGKESSLQAAAPA